MTIVLLNNQATVVTVDGGVISGDLDVQLGRDHRGMVRHRRAGRWFTIGNSAGATPRTWVSLAALAGAINRNLSRRDTSGNLIPFEC